MRQFRLSAGLALLAAVSILLAAGCSVGDLRRPPPARPSAPSVPRSPAGPDEVRQVRVSVPVDYHQRSVEFADPLHGYALFVGCTGDDDSACPAMLLSTSDGGRSWQELRHPQPLARNHQMYVGAAWSSEMTNGHGGLLLFAEPHGWYHSVDGGRTFFHEPWSEQAPDVSRRLFGRFEIEDGSRKLVDWAGGRPHPVPTQPPIPEINGVAYAGGRLLVSGVRDGRPYAALSTDYGKTWHASDVPDSGGVLRLQAHLSADGEDAWLVGDVGGRFPKLWRYGGRWEPVSAAGHPERFISVAAIGGGMLAVTSPGGSGVVTPGHYNDLGWPVRDVYLRVLGDGTLFGIDQRDGTVWLGEGWGAGRKWIKIVLVRT